MDVNRFFLGFCCFLAFSFRCEAAGCTFYFPASPGSSECEGYDLSKIASLGGVNFTSEYSYVFTVCNNVADTSIPDVCGFNAPSPAYQYDKDSCYSLGSLNSPFAVSSKSRTQYFANRAGFFLTVSSGPQ